MKPYPSYKPETRLPGVDQVPAHWKVVRNSLVFIEVSETGYSDLELLSTPLIAASSSNQTQDAKREHQKIKAPIKES